MTTARFDELIHPSTRLTIMALLAAADWVDFAFVRDEIEAERRATAGLAPMPLRATPDRCSV